MSDERKVTEVSGTITTADGQKREFSITAGLGWQQWGNTPDKLGNTVDVVEAVAQALAEHLADKDEQEDEL